MSRKTVSLSLALAVALTGLLFTVSFLGLPGLGKRESAASPQDSGEILRRLDALEERLEILDVKFGEYLLGDAFSAYGSVSDAVGVPEDTLDDSSAEADDESRGSSSADSPLLGIHARLDDLDLRVRGLEVDPVERGFRFLESDNGRLRLEGIRLLARVARDDPEALAAIRDMLEDPDHKVRIASIDALGDAGDQDAIPGIAQLLSDAEAGVRREAIFGLLRLGGRNQGHTIVAMLADPDKSVRAKAVYALGRMKYAQAAEPLLQCLRDADDYVRGEAIAALGQIREPGTLPALRDLYDNNPGRQRYRLVLSLKALGDSGPFEKEYARLSEILETDPSPDARLEAVRGLSWFARSRAQKLFRSALNDPDRRVRSAARKLIYSNRRSSSRSGGSGT